jgi:tetratricopeptide (TPR) repeat protein
MQGPIGAQPAARAPPARFEEALSLQQRGQLSRARELCEEMLRIEPRQPAVLRLLGLIGAQSGDAVTASRWLREAIAIDPNDALAHSLLGALHQQLAQWDAALSSYDRALAVQPQFAPAHLSRGDVLKRLGRREAALASYDQAIALNPGFAEAHLNRGVLLGELSQWAVALASFDRAIAIRSDYAPAHSNRGAALKALDRFEQALASYDRAILIDPRLASAHANRAEILLELERRADALASSDRAIALKGDFAAAHLNRGNALRALGRWDEALASYERATAIRSDYAVAHSNRGAVLGDLNRWEAALASYQRAIELEPDFAEAHFNRAVIALLLGDFDAGWAGYEWRWKNRNGKTYKERRDFAQPLWLGEDSIAGRTILLHCEQGLGDTLQFCRYAPLVAAAGAQVILEVQPPLERLLGGLAGISRVVAKGAPLPPFDCHCPLMSLPLAFKTTPETIPASEGYLRADRAKIEAWRRRLGERSGPRIGLVWSGNPRNADDRNRSIPLRDLMRHLPKDVEYFCLQNEVRESDRSALASCPQVSHFADDLGFESTAALCELMDLVVSVDTSIAHLSGALGRDTWILLPHNGDWRWLSMREDSPWYASARLFRQTRRGDWDGVLERVAARLPRVCR